MRWPLLFVVFLFFQACSVETEDLLRIGVSADYPPFEFVEKGELRGFDIDLGHLIAMRLGKKARFEEKPFNALLPSLAQGRIDCILSTVTISEERRKNFDFSHAYYKQPLMVVFPTGKNYQTPSDLEGKKVSTQLGTTMEMWLKQKVPSAQLVLLDHGNQTIEALKAGRVDAVVLDGVQSMLFVRENTGLEAIPIAIADDGYGVVLPKNSPLTIHVNTALEQIRKSGEQKALEERWFGRFMESESLQSQPAGA
jgi:polar amino acid transport system substrate-binding protein